MGTRKADLKKEHERAHKPGATEGAINIPPTNPTVFILDQFKKRERLHPAQR